MKFKISCLGEMLQRTQNSLVPHFGSRPYCFRTVILGSILLKVIYFIVWGGVKSSIQKGFQLARFVCLQRYTLCSTGVLLKSCRTLLIAASVFKLDFELEKCWVTWNLALNSNAILIHAEYGFESVLKVTLKLEH